MNCFLHLRDLHSRCNRTANSNIHISSTGTYSVVRGNFLTNQLKHNSYQYPPVTQKYDRAKLFSLRNQRSLPCSDSIAYMKALGIWRSRGCRGGSQHKIKHIPVVITANRKLKIKSDLRPPYTVAVQRSSASGAIFPSILYGNVRSLARKFGHLEALIATTKADICALTETWLHDWSADTLTLDGFQAFHVTRDNTRGGGVAILISRTYMTTEVRRSIDSDIELLHVKICKPVGCRSRVFTLHFVCFYRPPSGVEQNAIDSLCNVLDEIFMLDQFPNVILCGDANRMCLSNLQCNFVLKQLVSFPTRENACLDVILSNVGNHYCAPLRLAPLSGSDHCMIHTPAKLKLNRSVVRKAIVFDTREQHKASLDYNLSKVDWKPLLGMTSPNAIAETLTAILRSCIELSIPSRVIKITNRDPPWLTPVIKDIQSRRDKAFHLGQIELFNNLTQNLSLAIDKAKTDMFRNEKGNASKWWRLVNTERGKGNGSCLNNFLSSYNSIEEACSSLNSHFLSMYTRSVEVDRSPLVLEQTPTLFDEFEVANLLKSVKLRSAPGPDGLPSFLFKHFGIWLTKPIGHLINTCLLTGNFPEILKLGIVTPIPKIAAPKFPSQLRPISLTSVLSKILEKAILCRTKRLFRDIISDDQYAYRPSSSTTCALVHMIHSWLRYLNSSPASALRVIAIDYSKAFDSVEHDLLIAKLHSYNFPTWSIAIIRSFLTGRKQCVRINGNTSNFASVTRGIPQGSVMGPSLFTLFINDLKPENPLCMIHKFADDQTLTCPISPASLAEKELNRVVTWCAANKMEINLKKTREILISSRPTTAYVEPVKIGDVLLERTSSLNILGLTISNNLRWKDHISTLENKCRSDLFLLWRLKSFGMPPSEIEYLIRSLLLPKLSYAFPAWCNLNKSELTRLRRLYTRFSKAGNHQRLEPLEIFLDKMVLQLFEKALEPKHSLHELIPSTTNTRYSMRKTRFPLPQCRLTSFKNHFIAKGVSLYNRK